VTRVVVVDDQTLVRQGIRSLLEVAEVEVVGEADDGQAALDVIVAAVPDVVLLDLRMPRYDGIWALERLRERGIETPVLVLTTFNDDDLVLRALRAGARGYLLKDVTVEQLTGAVRALAGGGTLIAPSITDRLLRAIRSGPAPAEIAGALFLAEGTVKNHVSTILLKLDARDRTNAVLRALHEGILR
jgi:DNA-binding NarL/FixJ family response regulator